MFNLEETLNYLKNIMKYKHEIFLRLFKEDYYIFDKKDFNQWFSNKHFYQAIKKHGSNKLIKPIIIEFIKLSFYCVESALQSEENINLFFKCIEYKHEIKLENLTYNGKIEFLYKIFLKYLNRRDFFINIFDCSIWWEDFEKNKKNINCSLMHSKIRKDFNDILTIILED